MLEEFSFFINSLPFILVAVFLLAVFAFWKKKKFIFLIWVMIAFHLGLALAKSILQYWVWNQGGITQSLLNLPLKKLNLNWFGDLPFFTGYSHGYFLYYIWNNFWRDALLTIIAALLIYGIFLLLRRYKEKLFREGECEFGFLLALLIGWPGVIFFLPLIFAVAVIFSFGNWLFKRETITLLFWPLVMSAAIMLIFSAQLSLWRFSLLGL
jgi:hypothetical protein